MFVSFSPLKKFVSAKMVVASILLLSNFIAALLTYLCKKSSQSVNLLLVHCSVVLVLLLVLLQLNKFFLKTDHPTWEAIDHNLKDSYFIKIDAASKDPLLAKKKDRKTFLEDCWEYIRSSLSGPKSTSAKGVPNTSNLSNSKTSGFHLSSIPESGNGNVFGIQSSSESQGAAMPGTHVRNQCRGSRVASYSATEIVDGNHDRFSVQIQSISGMSIYEDKSHEELRSEDYEQGNKGLPGEKMSRSAVRNQCQGSEVASYSATEVVDGTYNKFLVQIQSISGMPIYKDRSHEELRSEVYELGNKGSQRATISGSALSVEEVEWRLNLQE